MLQRIIVGIVLAVLLAGCQNQQYKTLCRPQYNQTTCDMSNLDTMSCSAAKATVKSCSWFVGNEVRGLMTKKGQRLGTTQNNYIRPGAETLTLGSYGIGGSQSFAYVKADTPGAYVQSVDGAQRLMTDRVSHYQMAADRYVADVVSGTIVASDREVLKAIAAIEAMRAPLTKAVDMGKPILDFYAVLPAQDFAALANQVVLNTNARDPYLRAGADLAIRENKQYESNRPLIRVQDALAQFEALRTVAMVPYADQFAVVKKQAVILAAQAAHAAKQARAQNRAYEKQSESSGGYHGGGGCSCAGGNVCYGPRGGRYCITSGGNTRYGI